ncbi:hypothetical protein G6F57_021157 [Rhizopus arrhizus]|nr:hypothetical protein G6F57_021157 [Rhizopus arrhizus]
MKAPAPVRACEPGVATALQLGPALLGPDGCVVVHRVGVVQRAQDLARVDRLAAVERHHQRRVTGQSLQQVHAVTDRAGCRRVTRHMRVPCGPCLAIARQQRCVGVQHRFVGLVADGSEHLALDRVCVTQQRQRLVAVTGQDHLIRSEERRVGIGWVGGWWG